MENKGKGEEEGCKKQGRPTNVEVMRRERSHSAEEVAEIWRRKKKEREEKEEREKIFKKSALIIRLSKKEQEEKVRGMFEIIMKRMDDIKGGIKELKVDKGKLAEKIERMEKMVIGWGEERKKIEEKIEGL